MTPRQWQVCLAALLVLVAAVVQAVVIARLPGAVGGSLALAVVVALGMSGGQTLGAVAGFAAGLCLDVIPPAEGVLGVSALAFLVAGALAGRVRDPRGLAPAQLAAVLAGLSACGWLLLVLLGWALGGGRIDPLAGVGFVGVTTLLGLAVVPGVAWLMRRLGPGYRTSSRRRPRRPVVSP